VIVIDDQELLGRMLGGDEDAFTMLYRRRQGGIYRFALHMTGNAALAEDVTQEVFMTLIEHGERFEPARGSVAAFLYGIARNLVLRRVEKERANRETEIADVSSDVDLLQDLTRQETIDQVRRAVLSLPAVYREAVVLCDLGDMNYRDAADALDCPVGTVRSRLSRGRSMLAQKLSGSARSAMGSWG
jgi:RNA polymerase sigma-70 factor (ECF subfamily)